ncbi:MAG TPA: dipeptidase PepE [bacterium]|nr:dipeptidase PepE [bacterium]
MARRLLLLSNSTNSGREWLEHAEGPISDFLGSRVSGLLFFPFAAVTFSFDSYQEKASEVFQRLGYGLSAIHPREHPVVAVKQAGGYVVGGGNTWQLVRYLYEYDLMEPLRSEIIAGKPYIGWSAGANIACPTLQTTNDMPIVRPHRFETLGVIPFQINPHYLDANPEGHQGETREQRILEFLEVSRDLMVAGLREGSILRIENDDIRLLGEPAVRIFRYGEQPVECRSGTSMTEMLLPPEKENT